MGMLAEQPAMYYRARRQEILPVPLVRNSARNMRQISISDITPDRESPGIAVTDLRVY
jgi:hypothetical protein